MIIDRVELLARVLYGRDIDSFESQLIVQTREEVLFSLASHRSMVDDSRNENAIADPL